MQPIDDSSYENSSEEMETKNRFVNKKLSDSSSDDLRIARRPAKHEYLKASSKRLNAGPFSGKKEASVDKKGESGWRQEREAFVAAMRISRKIK